MRKLQVGDLCVTRNTRASLLNNGLLVVIVAIDPNRNGGTTPYEIRRIDGQPIPSTRVDGTGDIGLFDVYECWAPRSKLRRVDPEGPALLAMESTGTSPMTKLNERSSTLSVAKHLPREEVEKIRRWAEKLGRLPSTLASEKTQAKVRVMMEEMHAKAMKERPIRLPM